MRGRIITSLCGTLALSAAAIAQTPGLWLVGVAPGMNRSRVEGLSQDGSVAVGYSTGPGIPTPGFIWTAAGGRYDFGLEPGMPPQTLANAVNSDGSVIVGRMSVARAYRKVGSAPPMDLGSLLQYPRAAAYGVSGDGSVVVGVGYHSGTFGQAFRWTESGGMQALGWLPGGVYSRANAISRDGSTIVGDSYSGIDRAFVWTETGGMRALPGFPGVPFFTSHARGVNADGSVIVGSSVAADGRMHAVRWVGGVTEDIGIGLGNFDSYANAVSDNGLVVAGHVKRLPISAFVWTPATGSVLLSEYLASFGVTVPQGWILQECFAVSGDGLTFAGLAISSSGELQGFVATVPPPAGLLVLLGPALVRRRRRGMR